MRRVLLLGNFLSESGRVRSVSEDLAVALRGGGWDVMTVSRRPGRLARTADIVSAVWRLRGRYDVANVDVYSGAAFAWAEAACWALRRIGKPHTLALHGGGLPEFASRWPRRVARVLAGASAVATPSAYLRDRLGFLGIEIRVIPNAIELGRYPYRQRRPARPALAWLRTFSAIYDPALAVHAAALLAPDFPELRLTMRGPDAGDGALASARTAAAPLGERVAFPGSLAKVDVPGWLAENDVFLNTTRVDNTPVSVIEALACGLCVVSTDVGGIPFLLRDGEDALLVPPGSPDAMAGAVAALLRGPELAARLSANGRRKAEAMDWSRVLPRWDEMLAGAAPRAAA